MPPKKYIRHQHGNIRLLLPGDFLAGLKLVSELSHEDSSSILKAGDHIGVIKGDQPGTNMDRNGMDLSSTAGSVHICAFQRLLWWHQVRALQREMLVYFSVSCMA